MASRTCTDFSLLAWLGDATAVTERLQRGDVTWDAWRDGLRAVWGDRGWRHAAVAHILFRFWDEQWTAAMRHWLTVCTWESPVFAGCVLDCSAAALPISDLVNGCPWVPERVRPLAPRLAAHIAAVARQNRTPARRVSPSGCAGTPVAHGGSVDLSAGH